MPVGRADRQVGDLRVARPQPLRQPDAHADLWCCSGISVATVPDSAASTAWRTLSGVMPSSAAFTGSTVTSSASPASVTPLRTSTTPGTLPIAAATFARLRDQAAGVGRRTASPRSVAARRSGRRSGPPSAAPARHRRPAPWLWICRRMLAHHLLRSAAGRPVSGGRRSRRRSAR